MQDMGPSGRGYVLSLNGELSCLFGGEAFIASEMSLVWSSSFASGKLLDNAKTIACSCRAANAL